MGSDGEKRRSCVRWGWSGRLVEANADSAVQLECSVEEGWRRPSVTVVAILLYIAAVNFTNLGFIYKNDSS